MTKSDDLQMQTGPSSKPAGKRIEEGKEEFTHDSWNIVPSELNFNARNADGVFGLPGPDSIAPRRFNLFLLGTLAATALLMALVGIYGVVAYSVAQRTHEIGVRMALGAQRGEIVGMVIRQGIGLVLLGIGFGVVAALGLTRLMASLLYGVRPNDPQIFAAVTAILAATALLACWIPALRSAKVDPLIALRCE